MPSKIEVWARTERQFLKDDIKWLKAGSKLISPSGDDITAKKLDELEARLEHVQLALDEEIVLEVPRGEKRPRDGKPKARKVEDEAQSRRFLDLAHELEAAGDLSPTEGGEAFERALSKLFPPKTPEARLRHR